MKIIDLKNKNILDKTDEPLCLLIGNFDGVHEGHAKLIEVALSEGKRLGIKVAVWTFEQHPLHYLSDGVASLTDNEEKNRIFAEKSRR